MTFTQLEIFITLAELKGFTLAALKLGISQSAVSHSIKLLEKEFGIELVTRYKNQVELTDIGARLLVRAREIHGLSDVMIQEARSYKKLKMGSIKIASFGPSSTLHILPIIMNEFRKTFPEIDVYVEEGPDTQVVRWIEDRKVDLGFIVLPHTSFDTYFLIEDQFVALVPSNHPLAEHKAISLKDICTQPFIMTETGSEGGIMKLFFEEGLNPKIHSRTSQVLSTMALVSRGEGLAIVAELALPKLNVFEGFIVKPISPQKKRSVGLALKNYHQITPATQAFLQTALSLQKRNKLLNCIQP
jgi:DNA-binding transcriptional LysR family regulator